MLKPTQVTITIGRDCSPLRILQPAILFGTIQGLLYHRSGMSWNLERVLFTLRKWPIFTAVTLVHLVCCVISQTAKSICFLAVSMLQFETWWQKDITLLPGSSSKLWTNAILEETSFLQILEVKHGWLNKVWSYRHM